MQFRYDDTLFNLCLAILIVVKGAPEVFLGEAYSRQPMFQRIAFGEALCAQKSVLYCHPRLSSTRSERQFATRSQAFWQVLGNG